MLMTEIALPYVARDIVGCQPRFVKDLYAGCRDDILSTNKTYTRAPADARHDRPSDIT